MKNEIHAMRQEQVLCFAEQSVLHCSTTPDDSVRTFPFT